MEMTKEENVVRIFTSRARMEEKNQSALSIIQEKGQFSSPFKDQEHIIDKTNNT